jgi:hypothetical protein
MSTHHNAKYKQRQRDGRDRQRASRWGRQLYPQGAWPMMASPSDMKTLVRKPYTYKEHGALTHGI